jgi:hypothetical protein
LRVLLVGMQRSENQFSRALRKYDLEVVHISGDPGGHVPSDISAAVFGTCHMSHRKFDHVKAICKGRNIPIFISSHSFSSIKERFENFLNLQEDKMRVVRRTPDGQTVMAKAFQQAQEDPVAKKRFVHDDKTLETIHKIVKECFDAHMDIAQTAEMLKAEGHTKASGVDYSNQDISSIRWKLGLKVREQNAVATPKPVPAPAPKVPKAPKAKDAALDLIGQVLESKLQMDRKLHLIERIKNGEITRVDSAVARRVRLPDNQGEGLQLLASNILSEHDKPIITMSKIQALTILEALPAIHNFVGTN